jgi:hypothetical protein
LRIDQSWASQHAALLQPPLAANPQRFSDRETPVAWRMGYCFRREVIEGLPEPAFEAVSSNKTKNGQTVTYEPIRPIPKQIETE